ncbi:phosphotransferase [Vibrio sp. S4M6]|uniref:protein kinase domain-containing protein n=1 Tax=Vibrio sinus TaxID=2946865 RepID=UPI00202A11BE|nr:AarF/UbiB family protein [Vibrio sinus]MCL9783165.1 phosphotransferase [Vibrio sinus]
MFQGSSQHLIYQVQSKISGQLANDAYQSIIGYFRKSGIEFLAPLSSHVFLAQHPSMGQITLKFAKSTPRKAILKNEAEFLNSNPATHWPRIIDYTSFRTIDALVINYIEGSPLSELIKNNAPNPVTRQQLERLLLALHQTGYVHGDIKPSNIIFNPNNGQLSLIDFGSCRKIGTPLKDCLVNTWTPSFSGIHPSMDHLSAHALDDWYSVAILFAVLQGQHPYEGKPLNEVILEKNEIQINSLPAHYQLIVLKRIRLLSRLLAP